MTSAQKRISAAIFLMVLIFITLIFSSEALYVIKIVMESGYLVLLLWTYVIVSVLMHAFIVIKPKADAYGFFDKYSTTIYSIGTFGFGGGTSIALLKGLFLQHFYNIEFLKDFSQFDIISMLILTSFLLIYSLLNCTKQLGEAVFHTSTSDVKGSNGATGQHVSVTTD